MASADLREWLLCRAGAQRCAVPLSSVVETMRPLPIQPVVGSPFFVRGVSVIRGAPVPIVDVPAMVGEKTGRPRRLVTLAIGERLVGLAVDDVIGVEVIEGTLAKDLPPLLRDAAGDAIQAMRVLDGELLLLLEAGRLVPDGVLGGPRSDGPAP
jgi:purine-binding chemotaxis protein CheW